MSGRRSWVLGGALTALVVVVALLTWLLVRPDPYVAAVPTGTAAKADPAGAARALRGLEDAVTSGDADVVRALAPSSDPGAGDLLATVVDNAEELRVEEFSARYVDEVGAVDPSGRWQGAVDMTWRFDGFDTAPVHEEVLVTFDDEDGTVGIAGFGGGDRRSPLWL